MPKFLLALTTALLLSACGGDATAPDTAPNMIGRYSYSANIEGQLYSATVSITQQNGGAFSGTYTESTGTFPVTGSINGVTVSFAIQGPGVTINNNGTFSNPQP